MATKIQFRKDTGANWSSVNPVLADGEMGLNTTDRTFKLGNGVTAWNSLTTISGPAGKGISNIVRTSGTGLAGSTDTYTITFSDTSTTTFMVVNGTNGTNGINGEVTLAGVQTLTNKTITETVYNLTGTGISPINAPIQYKTLAANTTFTESLADGQSVTLMLNPSTFTTIWPTITWIGSVASVAPALIPSVYNCIVLFQVAGVVYGKYEGRV